MLSTLLLSFPLLVAPSASAFAQDPPAEEGEVSAEVDPVKAAEAAAQIREALKSKEEIVIVAALETLGQTKSKLVSKEVAGALKIKNEAVQIAALQALRFNQDPTAFDYLLKVRKEKSIQENLKTAVEYAYALGQKGDPKGIPALQDGLIATSKTPLEVQKAKVLALGHIRHKDSVEAILDYARTTIAGRGRGAVNKKLSREAHGALMILTGTDQGQELSSWEDWWYDHRAKFKISKTEGEIEDQRAQHAWAKLWMTPEEQEEAERAAADAKTERRDKRKEQAEAKEDSGGDDF